MRKRKFAIGSECKHLLEEAVRKRLPATITNKREGLWQVYKSNFLALRHNQIVLGQPAPHIADCHIETAQGQEIAVSFKKGYNKCLFVTRVVKPRHEFELEDQLTVPAISVYRPEQIEKIQRRAYDRTEPPEGFPVPVTFWASDNPEEKFQAQLSNICAG